MADDPFLSDISRALQQPAPSTPLTPQAPQADPFLQDIQGALSGTPSASAPTVNVSNNDLSGNLYGRLVAGMQGTSPRGQYKPAPEAHQWVFKEQDLIPDPKTEVALPDPAHPGKYQLYMRSPETEQGRVAGIAQVAPLMLPGEAPAVAAWGLSKSQNLLQDYEKLGIPPTAPAVGQGQAAGLISQAAQKIPFAGPPIQRAVESSRAGTAEAAERVAGSYGQAAIPEEAGDVIQAAIPNWAKSNKVKSDALYAKADSLIGSSPVTMTETLPALQGPMTRFPTSPQLGAMLTNPRLRGYADAITTSGGRLTFPEAQELRSTVGSMLRDPGLRGDIGVGDLKQVYGALTDDLRTAASASSPQALQAFDRATTFYRASSQRLEQLESVLGGSPENTFGKINTMAGTGKSADAGKLLALKKSMPPDEWGDVSSTVVSQMGQPTAGAKDVLSHASDFSPSSFATNWNKISDSAKDTLFGANVPGSDREALEALVRVAGAQKNVSRLTNVSHSGEVTLTGFGMLEMGRELFSEGFRPGVALSMIGGALGANGTSRLLMTPGFARWLYGLPSLAKGVPTPGQAAQRYAAGLSQFMRTANVSPENPSTTP